MQRPSPTGRDMLLSRFRTARRLGNRLDRARGRRATELGRPRATVRGSDPAAARRLLRCRSACPLAVPGASDYFSGIGSRGKSYRVGRVDPVVRQEPPKPLAAGRHPLKIAIANEFRLLNWNGGCQADVASRVLISLVPPGWSAGFGVYVSCSTISWKNDARRG